MVTDQIVCNWRIEIYSVASFSQLPRESTIGSVNTREEDQSFSVSCLNILDIIAAASQAQGSAAPPF